MIVDLPEKVNYRYPVFVIGTPKFQDRVFISTKSYSLRCSLSIPSILSTACLERA